MERGEKFFSVFGIFRKKKDKGFWEFQLFGMRKRSLYYLLGFIRVRRDHLGFIVASGVSFH